ncbi:MAG: hypothetical protein ACE14P_13040 [Methanotrichaceae archaeon]
MKPCVVGIGGAGGKILEQFLQNIDLNLIVHQFGETLAFGDVKGIWLESATQDTQAQSFYGSLVDKKYPPYLICHGGVNENSPTRNYVMDIYGFDLKAMGFDRRAEYLKALFEVFQLDDKLKAICLEEFKSNDNPLSGYMWKVGIRPFTTIAMGKSAPVESKANSGDGEKEGNGRIFSIPGSLIKGIGDKKGLKPSKYCDSILFLASLGGGTGTGFINPITSFVRSEEAMFPIFALGILTEKGIDTRYAVEGQRYLGAVIAMYDLLTRESGSGIDGLMLIDNQILKEKFWGNFSAINGYIYEIFKPLLDPRNYPGDELQDDAPAIRRVFWETDVESAQIKKEGAKELKLLPPMLVPCYYSQLDIEGDVNTLVGGALSKGGRLFPCDPAKSERALVFTRGFFSIKEIADAVEKGTKLPQNKIKIYKKLGDSKNEDILILLRNPYGGSPDEHKREGTLERRLHEIISISQNYIDENEKNILGFQSYKDISKEKLWNYFYGEKGLGWELYNCLDRLEKGEKPVFQKPLSIFGSERETSAVNGEICKTDSEVSVEDKLKIREMVKAELKEILRSEDCRRRIKEILQS